MSDAPAPQVPDDSSHGDLPQLGSQIRERRKAKGLSQRKLGALCGVDAATVCRVELGRHDPVLTTLARIASALGFRVALLDG